MAEVSKTISVRPPKDINDRIAQLAADLDKSPGQLLVDSTVAILEMVEQGDDLPNLVKVARALRKLGVTFSSKKARPTATMGLSLAGAM